MTRHRQAPSPSPKGTSVTNTCPACRDSVPFTSTGDNWYQLLQYKPGYLCVKHEEVWRKLDRRKPR